MANEVEITEMRYAMVRGQVPTPQLSGCVSQQINASGTQDDSDPLSEHAEVIRVKTTVATRIAVWDTVGTITAANSHLLSAGISEDFDVGAGQIVSSKVV